MHLAIYKLVAVACAFSASTLPLPVTRLVDIADETIKRSILTGDTIHRHDSPRDLLRKPGGFTETGGHVRRWRTNDDTSDDDDQLSRLTRSDSPLHNLPDHGVLQSGASGPRIKDSHAWFVNFALLHLIVADILEIK